MASDELIDIFAECVDDLLGGRPVAVCLERHRAHRSHIEPLLLTVEATRRAGAAPARQAETAARSRKAFLDAAAALRSQMLRATADPTANPAHEPEST